MTNFRFIRFFFAGLVLLLVCACSSEPQVVHEQQTNRRTVEIPQSERQVFTQCFKDAAKQNPAFQGGELVFTTTIEPDGKLANPSLKSSDTNNPAFDQCVYNQVKQLTLPKPERREIAEFKLHLIRANHQGHSE